MGDGLTFRAVILCDDVRVENNGKHILIGVYSGDIYVSEFAFQLPLRLWINVTPKEVGKQYQLELRSSFSGKGFAHAKISFDAKGAGDVGFALPPFVINGTEEGEIVVEVEQDGHWQVILRKKVLKPPTSASLVPPSLGS